MTALPLWVVVASAILSSGVVAGAIGFLGIRYQVRASKGKTAAETYAAGTAAQNDTIDRLSKENDRLSKKVTEQDTRIDELERRVDVQDARERLFIRHIALTDEWMSRVEQGLSVGDRPRLILREES